MGSMNYKSVILTLLTYLVAWASKKIALGLVLKMLTLKPSLYSILT